MLAFNDATLLGDTAPDTTQPWYDKVVQTLTQGFVAKATAPTPGAPIIVAPAADNTMLYLGLAGAAIASYFLFFKKR